MTLSHLLLSSDLGGKLVNRGFEFGTLLLLKGSQLRLVDQLVQLGHVDLHPGPSPLGVFGLLLHDFKDFATLPDCTWLATPVSMTYNEDISFG